MMLEAVCYMPCLAVWLSLVPLGPERCSLSALEGHRYARFPVHTGSFLFLQNAQALEIGML